MTQYSDLAKRLRHWSQVNSDDHDGDPLTERICAEAAAALEELEKRCEELAALKAIAQGEQTP